jgi:hypothetical protein
MYVAGNFTTYRQPIYNRLIRTDLSGSIDTTFNMGTGFPAGNFITCMATQSDGKLIVGGNITIYSGSSPSAGNLIRLKEICDKYNVILGLDNCESSFSYYYDQNNIHKSILKLATSSTSVFFSHLTMNGTEGGFIFTESDEEDEWYRMARSHGLTRGMPDRYKNPNVNSRVTSGPKTSEFHI